MKKIFILATALIGLSTFLNAQNSFPTDNAIWNYKVWADDFFSSNNGERNVYYVICGDTIVDDIVYDKLYSNLDTVICGENLGQFIGGFRQDGQKVYFLPYNCYYYNNNWRCSFGSEFLLYDFGLSIGEEIELWRGFYYNFWDRYPHDFETEQYKTYVVNNITIENGIKIFDFGDDIWYEGIGSVNGLFHRGEQMLNGYCFEITLNCFKHNDTVKYINNSECNNCFCENFIDIKENTTIVDNIKIFPNPVKDILNIELPKDIIIKSVIIYGIDGKLIEKNMFSFDAGQLNISNLQTGSYILNVNTDKGNFNKLIIKN
ncbi:T9SS type A sorting domain-containing protein [Bacteroidales bacterium OttesenSCG-928-I21]|nr:T9SS type A sorting domain-containing protein [Bacteroidales bacterium OttesenSCG-928-I21]